MKYNFWVGEKTRLRVVEMKDAGGFYKWSHDYDCECDRFCDEIHFPSTYEAMAARVEEKAKSKPINDEFTWIIESMEDNAVGNINTFDCNKKAALVIIDVQVALVDELLFKGNELLKNISYLIQKARLSNIPIIYIQHTEDDNEVMGKGKEGWKIHPKITPAKDDIVILKYTPDSFHETSLHEELSSKNIKKLLITGLQTEYCVDTTCRSAFRLGYETILVEDGHSTYDTEVLTASEIIEHHNMILSDWFVQLKSYDEVEF